MSTERASIGNWNIYRAATASGINNNNITSPALKAMLHVLSEGRKSQAMVFTRATELHHRITCKFNTPARERDGETVERRKTGWVGKERAQSLKDHELLACRMV